MIEGYLKSYSFYCGKKIDVYVNVDKTANIECAIIDKESVYSRYSKVINPQILEEYSFAEGCNWDWDKPKVSLLQ